MITYDITKTELRDRAKFLGYCVRFGRAGDLEVYPKRQRGSASTFRSNDDQDGRMAAISFMQIDRVERFKELLETVRDMISDETRTALIAWFRYHGEDWLDELIYRGWYYGRYDGFGHSDVSGILQRLRNTNGHEVLAKLYPERFAD
jgi:hypothetical protein